MARSAVAHLATLVHQLKASRPGALLLDGGDTWQGSGLALWSQGQDMVDAALLLGVDVMTAHWEMTLGEARVNHIVNTDFKDKITFLAQNITTADFGDPVFEPYTIRVMNGVPVAIIGQAASIHPGGQSTLSGTELDFRHPGRGDAKTCQ